MRLESAMYAGREGITAHGQAIAVVGDNIANVNTTAYKGSRVEFADLVSKGSPGAQVSTIPSTGDGVSIREVRQLFAGGTIDPTGRELDLGIDGNGFFIVGSAAEPRYTRAGSFSLNSSGEIVTADGLPLLGFPTGAAQLAPLNVTSIDIRGNATTTGAITGNLDAGLPIVTAPDAPQSFKDLGAVGGFTSSIRVFDSLGAAHEVNVYYFKTAQNEWTVQAYVDGADVAGEKGVPALIGQTRLTFSENGSLAGENQTAAAIAAQNIAWSNGAQAGNFTLSLGEFTQYASPSAIRGNTQDGQSVGNVLGYSVANDGTIQAVLSSGSRQTVGTVPLINFTNLDALDRIGNNLYVQGSEDAGVIDPSAPGTNSLGLIKSGALERSNVDLSSEFVDLVVYQRGYQASSQTIQAVNQLIERTIGLIR